MKELFVANLKYKLDNVKTKATNGILRITWGKANEHVFPDELFNPGKA